MNGIETFANAMKEHANEYMPIGGSACSIPFNLEGEVFRATKNLDVVVLTDAGAGGFARDLWAFIKENGYDGWKRTDGKCSYYRFNLGEDNPNATGIPGQIELFARHPDFALAKEDSEIAPLPFDEDVSSLSAIILDDGYYEFIRQHVSKAGNVPLLSALHIIPLKMRAHVDLNRKHEAGRRVNDKDLTKHRADVSKLSRLLRTTDRLPLVGKMREDARAFLEDFWAYTQRQTNRKQRLSLENDYEVLRLTYLGN